MRINLPLLFVMLLSACIPFSPPAPAPPSQAASGTPFPPALTETRTVSTTTLRPATATPQPTPSLPFAPSSDPVLFADPQGRVIRLDLASGRQTALSEPGVYRPADLLQPYPFGHSPAEWTPVLSPNLRFLALPDPAGSGTWLLDLAGNEPARKLLDAPAALSWSPDGAAIAWIRDGQLTVQDISGGAPRVLTAMDGLLNVAWSPKENSIAVASRAPDDPLVTLSLVDAHTGAVQALAQARPVSPTGGGFDLAWTQDGGEVWYSPAMLGYAVAARSVRPLLSPYVFAGERQSMVALSTTPDHQWYAYPSWDKERAHKALQINQGMFAGSLLDITFDQGWAAYAWTEEGNNLIVQEGSGAHARLWRIHAGFMPPAYYVQAADAGEILATGHLIGTYSHLAQVHRQLAPGIIPTRREPPAPEYVDVWGRTPMAEARLTVEHPMYWEFNWPGMGDVATTLSNFEMTSGVYLLSLSPEWFYAHFDSFTPAQGSPQAYLEEVVFSPHANAEWHPVTIDGRAGYRVRWKDRPTHEEVYVPFEDNTIVRIQKYPLHSDHNADFERMLRTAQWLPPDQWAVRTYPTETPDPTQAAVPALRLVGTLPAPHWRDGLVLVAVTNQGEIARATTTRLTFYDPASLEITRTGLVTLPPDLEHNTLTADGNRLARVVENTIEILDLTGLNEQADPPVLGAFQAARREIAQLAFSPDGKTLAVVSQASRDDLAPALLEVYDTQQLRPYASWELNDPPGLAFSPNSRWLASRVRTGTASITYYALDPAAQSAYPLTIPRKEGWDWLTFSPGSDLLAAASSSGQILFWTVPGAQVDRQWQIDNTSVVSGLAFDPDNRYLAITNPEGTQLRQLAGSSLAGFANQHLLRMAFIQRGTELFLTGMDGNGALLVWSIEP